MQRVYQILIDSHKGKTNSKLSFIHIWGKKEVSYFVYRNSARKNIRNFLQGTKTNWNYFWSAATDRRHYELFELLLFLLM